MKLGCSLLNALLASSDGLKFLADDDFLNQIVKSFAQLDPVRVPCFFVLKAPADIDLPYKVQRYNNLRSNILESTDGKHSHVRLL